MGFSEARLLEWVAISFSRGSSGSRDRTWVPFVGGFFATEPLRKLHCPLRFISVTIFMTQVLPSALSSTESSSPCLWYDLTWTWDSLPEGFLLASAWAGQMGLRLTALEYHSALKWEWEHPFLSVSRAWHWYFRCSRQLHGHCIQSVCVSVAQSCPTLCDPVDCSPPGSPVPVILQAGTPE